MSTQHLPMEAGTAALMSVVDAINSHRDWLSEIDGAIGDGDHGINMSTGFTLFRDAVLGRGLSFPESLYALGETLLEETGGSLGPLYGSMFLAMGETLQHDSQLSPANWLAMLVAGRDTLMEIGGAKPGDKTLLDCLCPAIDRFAQANAGGESFAVCLAAMREGAMEGRDSTRGMLARIGRASRLGERSRDCLDAGAASCCLILSTFADSLQSALPE